MNLNIIEGTMEFSDSNFSCTGVDNSDFSVAPKIIVNNKDASRVYG